MNNSCLFARRFENPCPPNCENRRPACHDSCERYLTAKKKYEEDKERIKKGKYAEYIANMTPKRSRKR